MCSFVRNALCEDESLSKEIKLDMGCCVHFRVPFLMAIRISRSINSVRGRFREEEFKKLSLPVIGSDS